MVNDLLKQTLARGEAAVGMMLSELYVPNIARLLAGCGIDYLLVDCEHGYFDMTQVANLIAVADGADLPIIVRVTQPSRTNVTKYLDMGAQGILLSNVADGDEARQLVKLCKYAPEGDRGISTFRAHTGYADRDIPGVMRRANDGVIIACQIESPQALERIDDIAGTDGVDGLLVGPNDLSQHMGLFGQYDHPRMTDALRRVAQAASARGKWSGVITANERVIANAWRFGMRCFSAGSELGALRCGGARQVASVRAMLKDA